MDSEPVRVDRLVGVYNADGSLSGALEYLVGRWRGTHHCELCDITHGFLTKKRSFRDMCERLSVPFDLVHLDERSHEVAEASAAGVPCVLAVADGAFVVVMDAEGLRACGGDVAKFELDLRDALHEQQLSLER